jgi:predicted nucleic acid-binding protein
MLLNEIEHTIIKIEDNNEIAELAIEIANKKILPMKSANDRVHIASAVLNGCNAIISWNFKHMVNVKTIDGVRVVCIMNNLPQVDIYSPTMLLERSGSDE